MWRVEAWSTIILREIHRQTRRRERTKEAWGKKSWGCLIVQQSRNVKRNVNKMETRRESAGVLTMVGRMSAGAGVMTSRQRKKKWRKRGDVGRTPRVGNHSCTSLFRTKRSSRRRRKERSGQHESRKMKRNRWNDRTLISNAIPAADKVTRVFTVKTSVLFKIGLHQGL